MITSLYRARTANWQTTPTRTSCRSTSPQQRWQIPTSTCGQTRPKAKNWAPPTPYPSATPTASISAWWVSSARTPNWTSSSSIPTRWTTSRSSSTCYCWWTEFHFRSTLEKNLSTRSPSRVCLNSLPPITVPLTKALLASCTSPPFPVPMWPPSSRLSNLTPPSPPKTSISIFQSQLARLTVFGPSPMSPSCSGSVILVPPQNLWPLLDQSPKSHFIPLRLLYLWFCCFGWPSRWRNTMRRYLSGKGKGVRLCQIKR